MTRLSSLIAIAIVAFSAASAAVASPYSDQVLADNPLVYLNFNETVGTTANNLGSLGAAANGNYISTPLGLASAPGANLGTSAGFNGSTSNVRVPDNAAFDVGSGPFSVELWFQTTTTNRGDLFTYKGAGGDYGIHSESQSAGTASTFFNSFNGQVATPINAWHQLVNTRGAGGVYQLYVDGVLLFTGNDTDSWNIANDILIGSNHTGNPSNLAIPFLGNIDEVSIYSTALSGARVAAHFTAAFQFIPEPATATLSMLALGAMGLRRRRAA